MTAPGYVYDGIQNLEVMADARNYNAWLLDELVSSCSPGATVLDFGAGAGTFAREMRGRGFDVVCVEPDSELSGRLAADGFRVVPHCADLGEQSFDLVYTLNVLEHLDDDAEAIRLLASSLKPGGRLFVYVPAFEVLFGPMDRKVGHRRRYRAAGLRRLVESSSLRVERLTYADSLGFVAALVYRFIGPADGSLDRESIITFDRWIFPMSRLIDRLTGRLLGKNLLLVARAGQSGAHP